MVAHQCDRGKASIQLYGPRAAPTGSLSHFGGGVAAQTLHFGDVHPHGDYLVINLICYKFSFSASIILSCFCREVSNWFTPGLL